MGNWIKVNIKDILKILYGKDYKDQGAGNIPVYGTGGIMCYINNYLCNWNCVCIGRKGTINKPIYIDQPFWCVDTLFYSKAKNYNSPKFQYYLFQTINWDKLNEASGVPSLSSSTIEKIKIFIPNTDEQKRIADFLSLIDQRIDTQSKIIEDLELFKKGIENQYFSCNKNNEYVILGDVITQINNRNEKNIDFEVLSVSNKYGFIPQSEQFDDHEVASANKSNYKIVKQNDFAYNPARINVGSIAMLRNNQVGIVSPMYICFRANNNRILSSYLDYFSHSNKFNNEVLKNLEGSVRLCLSFESLSKIKIHLPSLDTQYEIVKNLDLISNKISIENKILEKLKEQKKYLLSNMFI